MKKIQKFKTFLLLILISSCSTLKKTMIYSSASGGLLGGYIGRELSPNKESDNFNTVIGFFSGAAISSFVGYFFYKDANPSIDLKNSPLPSESPLLPIKDSSFSFDKIQIIPKIMIKKDKEYLNLSSEVPGSIKKSIKKQYFKKYQTESYSFEENGKTYQIPSFEIIETGVE